MSIEDVHAVVGELRDGPPGELPPGLSRALRGRALLWRLAPRDVGTELFASFCQLMGYIEPPKVKLFEAEQKAECGSLKGASLYLPLSKSMEQNVKLVW